MPLFLSTIKKRILSVGGSQESMDMDYVSGLASNDNDEIYAVWREKEPNKDFYSRGSSSTHLTKLSSSGQELWSKELYVKGYDYPWGVETLASGQVVVYGVAANRIPSGGLYVDEWKE